MKTILKMVALIAFMAFFTLGVTRAADWELWSDKTQMPPGDQTEFLPLLETGEAPIAYTTIYLDQTLEKDGKQYKACQPFKDRKLTATMPVGKYLLGNIGTFYPTGTVDPVEMMKAERLVSIEIDGTVIPIDESYLLSLGDFPFKDQTLAFYNVFPRFNTPGKHTFIETFKIDKPFFFIEPFKEEALCTDCGYPPDQFPEFEGRYVFVPEQVGDPVDGKLVYSYTLTVIEKPTAVTPSTWGKIKEKVKQILSLEE